MNEENKRKFDELLSKVPAENQIFIKYSMALASQITKHLRDINKNQKFLADKLEKSESEISKWLNGTHNFTLRTLAKIESVLGKELFITFQDISEYQATQENVMQSLQAKVEASSNSKTESKEQSKRSPNIYYLNKYVKPSISSTNEPEKIVLTETEAV